MAEQAVKAPGRQAKFVEGNLFRHITVMSLTNSVGLMAIFSVDLINMVFISMLNQEDITAAVGYAGRDPVFHHLLWHWPVDRGFGAGGAGGGAAQSGDGARKGHQRHDPGDCLWHRLCRRGLGVFARHCQPDRGAAGRTHELTVHFLRIVIPAQPFLMVGMIGGAILRSHGDAKRAMAATLWGALANAVLDPILIFGLHLGSDRGCDCLGGVADGDCGRVADPGDPASRRL